MKVNNKILKTNQWCLMVLMFVSTQFFGQTWIEYYEPHYGLDIVEASNGDLVTLGEGSPISNHIFLCRVDSEGDEVWKVFLNMFADPSASGQLLKKSNNNFIVAGHDNGAINGTITENGIRILEIDNDGNIIWEQVYFYDDGDLTHGLYGFIETSDGGFLLSSGVNVDNNKSLLIKFDAEGNFEWESELDGISSSSIIELDNGDFALAGTYQTDIALMGVTQTGIPSWTNYFGSANFDRSIDIVQTSDNQLAILGAWENVQGFGGFHTPILLKTSITGDSLWSKSIDEDYAHYANIFLYPDNLHLRPDGGFDVLTRFESIPVGEGIKTQIIQLDENGDRINEENVLHNAVSIAMTPCQNGGYAVVGLTQTPEEIIFIAKADVNGQFTTNFIEGNIFKDDNFSCDFNFGEIGLKNWLVSIEDLDNEITFYTNTDESGNYELNVFTGSYEVTANIPHPVWESCSNQNPQTVILNASNETAIANFPMQPILECPILNIEISAPFLRRCFDNIYYVEYCNKGTESAENAYVEVTLDEFMTVNSASLNFVNQGDTLLVFPVGDVDIGECGQFSIDVYLDCDNTVLGQTHCSEAHVFPDTICFPTDPNWDLSSISVSGECEQDSVRFFIQNEGTGNMTQPSTYYIVIDEVILYQDNFQLNSGGIQEVAVAASAQTVRLDADQSPGHPGNSMPSATVEGCPEFATLGFFSWFAQNDLDNFIDIDCQPNVGAYDPNDKQAFPRGYGDQHQIEPETEIEYKIRFQNTGTDTAFRVVVRDTLSEFLDISTFQMDVASHHYDWEILGHGILKVTFQDIMLPDSTINEPASHGFFKYSIRPKVDVPLGTVIENRAGIYFDFNEPIITNTVFHTVDTNFVEIDLIDFTEDEKEVHQLTVMPNPFSDYTIFKAPRDFEEIKLEVFDAAGRLVVSKMDAGNQLRLEKNDLRVGIYFFNIKGDGKYLGAGKLVIQ